jgi:hypothetical protein
MCSAVVNEIEDHARHEERGEDRRGQTDEQRDRETFDRSTAELEEEEGRDDGGQMRVDDRSEGQLEARLDRVAHRLAGA